MARAVVFPGGVGNTHKDPKAFASLIHDVEIKVFDVLPDETWVYPGHGNDTTLGAERPQLPEWRARVVRDLAGRTRVERWAAHAPRVNHSHTPVSYIRSPCT
ncbi:glyoxylase-like metal-dependent hydrolase (beta-lactamase superfamily II) [Streptomyces africanus]|uniref:Glyoxylase-like metal-dependent hydrolase (Beta-lactamase superfamily II) n=1 Tax=Streptomyces africanus TaxID=231024 RepID=A0ABU0QMF5_9ACTN|nr:glyoxylase-like metal-dependent hydrolase (beta-lactamase superfamily II) [Streptomyces africanus]